MDKLLRSRSVREIGRSKSKTPFVRQSSVRETESRMSTRVVDSRVSSSRPMRFLEKLLKNTTKGVKKHFACFSTGAALGSLSETLFSALPSPAPASSPDSGSTPIDFVSSGNDNEDGEDPPAIKYYKLALQPHPVYPGRLSIHGLWIVTHKFKQYRAPREQRCNEVYDETKFKAPLLESLRESWLSNEEPRSELRDERFRRQQWKNHGKSFGLTLVQYFSLAIELFNKSTKYLDLGSFSTYPVSAGELSAKVEGALEAAFGVTGAHPDILCFPPDAEGKVRLKEIRICFVEVGQLPTSCGREYGNCLADTPIHL